MNLIWLAILAATFLQPQGGVNYGTFPHEDRERTFRLYLPENYDGEEAVPLIVVLHPAGGNGDLMAQITGFDALAERDGAIVVYPEGPFGYWDYGAGLPGWEAVPDVLDDPGYVVGLVTWLQTEFNIDPERIYAVGFSNGARMAFRMGCEMPDTFAGIAAVAATISDEVTTNCPAEAQPAVLYMHGRHDEVIPWYAKPLRIENVVISHALSAPDTAAFWAAQSACDLTETPSDSDPSETITLQIYASCESDQTIQFYAMEDGSHEWFDNASAVIWDFFMEAR